MKLSMLRDIEKSKITTDFKASSNTNGEKFVQLRKLPPPAPKTDPKLGWRKQDLPARPIKSIRKPELFAETGNVKSAASESGKITSRIDIIPQPRVIHKPPQIDPEEMRGRQPEKRVGSARCRSVGRLSRKREIIGQFEPPKYVLDVQKVAKPTSKR